MFSNGKDQFIVINKSFVHENKFEAQLLNYKGAYTSTVILQFNPEIVLFNSKRAVFIKNGRIYVWDFSKNRENKRLEGSETKFFFFDLRNPTKILDLSANWEINLNESQKEGEEDKDIYEPKIESIDISENNLYLCNQKGFIKRFSLLNFVEQTPIMLKERPNRFYISSNENYIALIDQGRNLSIMQISEDSEMQNLYEDQDVWRFFWSTNDKEFFYNSKNLVYELDLDKLNKEHPKKSKKKKRKT